MTDPILTDDDLDAIEGRSNAATKGPWQSYVEGRDHLGGSNVIVTGGLDDRSPDIEIANVSNADQDFIAHSRQDVPRLVAEVRRLRAALKRIP